MALTLLRHAALHPRHHKRYNGWTNLPIDPTHFDHAIVQPLRTIPFDHIYSSDLIRCQETLHQMGITNYTTDTRLREVRFRAHIEGLSYQEVSRRKDFEQEYLKDPRIWHLYICAEHYDTFRGRIAAFLAALPPDREILVCTHGGVIQHMLTLLRLPAPQVGYLDWIRIEHYGL